MSVSEKHLEWCKDKDKTGQQRQAKLNALADKKKQGKLMLDDIYEQNQIVIEILEELRR